MGSSVGVAEWQQIAPDPQADFGGALGPCSEHVSTLQPALTCSDLALCLVHDELIWGHAEVTGALQG